MDAIVGIIKNLLGAMGGSDPATIGMKLVLFLGLAVGGFVLWNKYQNWLIDKSNKDTLKDREDTQNDVDDQVEETAKDGKAGQDATRDALKEKYKKN